MITQEERKYRRRAYHLDNKSIRRIAQEIGHCRDSGRNVITIAGQR